MTFPLRGVDGGFREFLTRILPLRDDQGAVVRWFGTSTDVTACPIGISSSTSSYLLHPPLLDENGLPAALSLYIRGLRERSGLDIAFRISEEFGRLTSDMELVVFRLVPECLANVHRHSGSKRAFVEVVREANRIMVRVRDQGKGISPEKLSQIEKKGSGVGIRGMRERLRQFRGEMVIDSSNEGAAVLVTIPVPQQDQKQEAPRIHELGSAV
jgi:two-component system, NarL family, sensor kinase